VLLGTGLFAEELTDLVADVPDLELAGYCENIDRSKAGGTLLGRPVVWIDELTTLGDVYAICAITTTARERYVDEVLALGIRFAPLVHPSAVIARTARLGKGVVIGAGVIIGAQTTVGDHVIINRGVLVGHHVRVGKFATIQPGAVIGGAGRIGPRAYIAMGANVLDRRVIGPGAVVGAGAVVVKDVPPHVQVVGVPAREVRRGVTGR
jgi:UDP-perosamine 4-acetyltransferase